jgi:hypothetical protein
MIGDMFNNGLKSRISAVCNELSAVVGRPDILSFRPQSSQWQSQGSTGSIPLPENSLFVGGGVGGGNWWPVDLGFPASTGAQNSMRYACFPDRRRLALDINGQISVYDTGDHLIGGFSQQQSGDQSLTFTSQFGTVRLDSLPLVSGPGAGGGFQASPPDAPPMASFAGPSFAAPPPAPLAAPLATAPMQEPANGGGDIFSSIERLGELRNKGLISDEEFSAKKAELLRRL